MKKLAVFLSFIFISCFAFLGYENVTAAEFTYPNEPEIIQNGNEPVYKLYIDVKGNAIDTNKMTINLTLINLDVLSFMPESSWYVESSNSSSHSYVLQTTKTSLEVGRHYLATIKAKKKNVLEECKLKYSLVPQTEKRSCDIYRGTYYGLNGDIVSALEWDKQCKPHSCVVLSDGTRFGINGNIVDEATYLTECGHVCDFVDGKYYGIDGTEVDQSTYKQQCIPKCKIEDGKYYGINGDIVTEVEWQKQCADPECDILSDGTIYGKDGNIVDEVTYIKECKEPTCAILSDGTIYGKDGNIVDQATFDKECKEPITCQIVDGNYYDKNGNIVSEEEYNKSCNPSCKQVGDTYYGKNGNIVEKVTYDKECIEVENPKTGAIVSIITLLGLGSLGVGAIYYAKKHNRFI